VLWNEVSAGIMDINGSKHSRIPRISVVSYLNNKQRFVLIAELTSLLLKDSTTVNNARTPIAIHARPKWNFQLLSKISY